MTGSNQMTDFLGLAELLSEEERMVQAQARQFVNERVLPVIERHAQEQSFPAALIHPMGELGFLGPTLPPRYGCAGLSSAAYGLLMYELERGDSALPLPERKRILEAMRVARPADWPVNRKRMEQAFRDHDAFGFCFGLGDWRREINAVAAPLALPDGTLVVVGVSGAAFQLEPETLKRDVGPRLLALLGNVRSGLSPNREAEGG